MAEWVNGQTEGKSRWVSRQYDGGAHINGTRNHERAVTNIQCPRLASNLQVCVGNFNGRMKNKVLNLQ
jgi:hypothetical protein